MLRKISFLFVILVMCFSCSQQPKQVVTYKPDDPKAGDKVTIRFSPQRLIETDQQQFTIHIIYQLHGAEGVKTFSTPMGHKKKYWEAKVNTRPGDYLLCIKFEDNLDRVEDNNGRGWNIIIKNENGTIQRNTYYTLGLISNQKEHSLNVPDWEKACADFERELSLFPDNYNARFELWYARIKKASDPRAELKKVEAELDSLLTASADNPELLALAFKTQLRLLNNPHKARTIGKKILTGAPEFDGRDEITYMMIFLNNPTDTQALVADLINFANNTKNPDYAKKAYHQLGTIFRHLRMTDRSIAYFQKYIAKEPNDVSVRLTLANYYLKKHNFDRSQLMIDQARKNNNDVDYFQANPWVKPVQRASNLNLTNCQILSTQAALDVELKKYAQAIRNRKKCITLGTPFPAFEWMKIGDIYFQTNKLDSAQTAYVKAISINSAQEDAKQKLKAIYQMRGNAPANFDSYLQELLKAELYSSAQMAPDFELQDLQGNSTHLSEQRGKIVVLVFWDSWSAACKKEIPQLNTLVSNFKNDPNVLFWAISVEAPISIKKFLKETPFQFRQLHSGFEVKKKFNIIGFPTHILIDGQGKIISTHIGYLQDIHNKLEKEIRSLLKEKSLVSR